MHGVVAAGHPATVQAAEDVLREGGNAFDAMVAAHFAACVAEPVLSSLAGGGFLLAYPRAAKPLLYDFFVQTPQQRCQKESVDFHPIVADFGSDQQEFHIGLGAMATPGCVSGLFQIHRDLCTIPLTRLVEPAIDLARQGLRLNTFQSYIFDIIKPIYLSTAGAREIYSDPDNPKKIVTEKSLLRQPQQADFIDALAREGEALFYRGEVAQSISKLSIQGGGHLSLGDLEDYRTIKRSPLKVCYRDSTIFMNPAPSSGGMLIAFALDLLENFDLAKYSFGSADHLQLLTKIMALTSQARVAADQDELLHPNEALLLDPKFREIYRKQILGRASSKRGTTHVSIIDGKGNIASMTVSNGEGCGTVIPGTGVMLNNMLGEEDINPQGFHQWPLNQRMTSMMTPGLVIFPDGRRVATGSGGSNRIRSAILQVLVNLIDYAMPLDEAVNGPRFHVEEDHLSIEAGFNEDQLKILIDEFPAHTLWQEKNLFFGGAHTVMKDGKHYFGVGDQRRGGVASVLN